MNLSCAWPRLRRPVSNCGGAKLRVSHVFQHDQTLSLDSLLAYPLTSVAARWLRDFRKYKKKNTSILWKQRAGLCPFVLVQLYLLHAVKIYSCPHRHTHTHTGDIWSASCKLCTTRLSVSLLWSHTAFFSLLFFISLPEKYSGIFYHQHWKRIWKAPIFPSEFRHFNRMVRSKHSYYSQGATLHEC